MIKSVYIHVPFCNSICNYCDFTKFYYNSDWVDKYLTALESEIDLYYRGEDLDTIYIGGGTPSSLSDSELERLLEIVSKFGKVTEYTIEVNIENITESKLKLMKEYGVSRISVGIQTINDKLIKVLGRNHNKEIVKNNYSLISKYFDNISVDLIYGINGETLKDLEEDLDFILSLDPKHISTYSLILEPYTKLYISGYEEIDEDLDYKMYELIRSKLSSYNHYEISNFSKDGYESKHNLTYWNNLPYYGFGLGSSGCDKDRYNNTRSFNDYIKGNYRLNIENIDKESDMSYFMILGLRKLKGVSKSEFLRRYKKNIKDVYDIEEMLKKGMLEEDSDYIKINPKYLYVSNNILINFVN